MNAKIFFLTTIFICFLYINSFDKVNAETTNLRQQIYPITECNDGIDNDSDGGIDFATDPQCISWEDNSETILEVPIEPDPNPEPNPNPNNNSQGSGIPSSLVQTTLILTDNEPNETIIQTSGIQRLSENYVWEPLGYILGIEEDNFSELIVEEPAAGAIFISVPLFIILIALVLIYLKRTLDDDGEDERT